MITATALDVPAVAEQLGQCEETIRRKIRRRQIRARKIGKGYEIEPEWVVQYLASVTTQIP